MTENRKRKSKRRRLSAPHLELLRTLIKRDGIQVVADQIGLHAQTVATLACAVEANLPTVLHAERELDANGMGTPNEDGASK